MCLFMCVREKGNLISLGTGTVGWLYLVITPQKARPPTLSMSNYKANTHKHTHKHTSYHTQIKNLSILLCHTNYNLQWCILKLGHYFHT